MLFSALFFRRKMPQDRAKRNSITPSPEALQLAARLAEPRAMRRGSLSERCTNARHGPYFSLTRAVQGKTQSRLISKVT